MRCILLGMVLLGGVLAPCLSAEVQSVDDRVDFNRDVRPILSEFCYECHGPDATQRQAGLRFDLREEAFADLGGYAAIVPGDVEQSELITRVLSEEEGEQMPPPDHRKSLSFAQKETLVRWVRQGANWSQHWAYAQPQSHALPPNWIDALVRRRLADHDLKPSPPAEPRLLVRRAYFDLIGLPPTPKQVDEYLSDDSPEAWENLVDRLLASPHFGERMAIYWLDLVRYADTVGYHGDQDVSVSPYRDYVINAFNQNLPFDQFTREQLAGDLLPEPTESQLIASGYNKLGMMSAEGGAQPKEYLAKYAADRVRTASSVWLGSTLACAECHDHKYDPFTQQDFYSFASFFADIQERGLYAGANRDGSWGPSVEVIDAPGDVLLPPLREQLSQLTDQYQATELDAEMNAWLQDLRRKADDSEAIQKLPEPIRKLVKLSSETPDAETPQAAEPTDAFNEKQLEQLRAHYRTVAPSLADLRQQIEELKQEIAALEAQYVRTSLITRTVEPREMRVLPRGNWMDNSGPVVEPDVPAFLPSLRRESDRRATRLDLANWLVSKENPLTARVMVNRFWRMFFGTGLSKVLDDLGSQGEYPTHPELLDQLAVEFVESGWNVKHIIKLIVMSETYRQSSLMRPELEQVDPYNRLLARQSRFRLDAEMIRDNALAVSGLLVRKVGGRSVKPYQPAGLLRHLNFPKREYHHDEGANQYRRGVYTHWQRQFLHPAMKSFDAPSREECTAQRPRSNTPLAALVMLNDPSYVEAARVLAERTLNAGLDSDRARIKFIFQHALSRSASAAETEVLENLIATERDRYREEPQDAQAVTDIGLRPVEPDVDRIELAATLAVTRAVFNMHEFITRN